MNKDGVIFIAGDVGVDPKKSDNDWPSTPSSWLHIGDSPSEQEVGTIEVRQDILSERLLTDVVGE